MRKARKRNDYIVKNRKPLTDKINCHNCENCCYVGEGGYMCGCNNEIVIDDFVIPTDEFYWCEGKEFVPLCLIEKTK